MADKTDINNLKVGCWLDAWRGYYIGSHIMHTAIEFGWPGPLVPSDDEGYADGWDAAEEFLNENIAPPGYHFGHNDMGDWGLWPNSGGKS